MTKYKTYIIHYSKLNDRKINLDKLLQSKNIQHEYIIEFDKENLTNEIISKYYEDNRSKFNSKVKLWDQKANKYYKMSLAEISCSIKHIEAIKKIAYGEDEFGLILEDDVIVNNDNYLKIIDNLVTSKKSWDAIFIGEGMGKKFISEKIGIKRFLPFKLFKIKHPATNCLEAYILKKDSAKEIYENLLPINLVIDWELAYQFYELKMNIYWSKSTLFYQGSKKEIYESTLR
tara:strand:+ start:1459 stop:2151 length:693 start_codon:yes stop_codon:yes gene_type:complete